MLAIVAARAPDRRQPARIIGPSRGDCTCKVIDRVDWWLADFTAAFAEEEDGQPPGAEALDGEGRP
jgi:hypothetical protein